MKERTNETQLARLVLGRPTLTEIAREAGVSVSYVSQVAAGLKRPSAKLREAASRVLGLPVRTIFPEITIGMEPSDGT